MPLNWRVRWRWCLIRVGSPPNDKAKSVPTPVGVMRGVALRPSAPPPGQGFDAGAGGSGGVAQPETAMQEKALTDVDGAESKPSAEEVVAEEEVPS